jgi:hypothetical protein
MYLFVNIKLVELLINYREGLNKLFFNLAAHKSIRKGECGLPF